MVWAPKIGRASCRERVEISAAAVSLKNTPRVQLPALKLPPPSGTLLAPQLTVPPGAVADSSVLSVTVAVQLLGLPTGTVSGVQLTTVLVACLRAMTSKVPALLRWVPSPL